MNLTLPSTHESIEIVLDAVEKFVADHDIDEEQGYKITLLATEAATNAIEHGNEMDASKNVHVTFAGFDDRFEVVVEDEGPGFDPATTPDPLAAANLMASGGRGIFLMRELADELSFDNGGRRITMVFRR
jgi:serine/threonine-protein kinase RsbW